ncbi:MAG: ABC transporter permease subunit [Rhizobiales bacterium]|nr:ABC transporter permease subunit [Hyphomicrobiales bacterium]
MTLAVPTANGEQLNRQGIGLHSFWVQMLIAIVAGLAIASVLDWAWLWPQDWIVPIKVWLSEFFAWLDKRATFGLFTVKQLTRSIAWMLKQPLIWSEYLLWKSARVYQYMPVFWIAFSCAAGFIVSRLRDGRTGVYVTLAILAIVTIDGFPYILQSLSKALRVDPWVEPAALIGISEWPGHFLSKVMGLREVRFIPWIAVVLGFGIFGHWVGGWRLAGIVILCMGYLAFTGLWRESMKTFSLVVVAVPFSAALGLWLGILVTRSERAARIITPMFDVMQATPHLAYLVPVVVMFGAGQVPALIATMIFAMPPMARCTILAIQTVPSDVVESGHMSGCTPRQLLWKVQLPASQKTLLLGLNQVIMQTLAMVVICSLVGAQGLGHKLLFSLQQLKLGFATMQGIAIVLMAVVLDRLTQAYANKASVHVHGEQRSYIEQHGHLIAFLAMLVVSVLAAFYFKDVSSLSRNYHLVTSKDALELDKVIKAVTFSLIDYIRPTRDFITVYMLIPMRDFYQALPWSLVAIVLAVAGYRLGNWKLSVLIVGLLFFIIVMIGNWEYATTTFYFVFTATIFCILIGVPLGLWAARSDRVAKVVMLTCDTLQTFPSFIYLLPAIMLFRVGELAIIFAIIPYATVPAIRYTYLGIKRISPVTLEAARMNGATPLQRLWKVELPVALPEIMLGINQTIMMALAMTAITALIGGQDLGQEIYRALPTSDAGRGVMAGLGIATLGIIADRLIGAWASKRKEELGVA